MADAPRRPDPLDFPEAIAAPKSRTRIQFVWLVPLIAILIGAWLAGKAIFDRGPTITITFDTAEGLEAGKTKLKYKNVDVGLVKTVELSQDTKSVIVTAELPKQAEPYLRDDTRFWMVRARISGGTVTGLGTLLSGSYIGVDIGKAGKPRRDFVGLRQPPTFTSDTPGREFVLHTDNIGSLDVGSPVYFRRLQAGQVTGYELDKDGKAVTINVFVNSPYDKFVNGDTRFWQSSGLDVSLDANGVKIDTQSIVSILIGGLVFETPLESAESPPATAKAQFHLFANRAAALKNPETDVIQAVMRFNESVLGLAVGAPIDFRGINLGTITQISAEYDDAHHRFDMKVETEIYPQRMRPLGAGNSPVHTLEQRQELIDKMIARGLRAQLRTANLLTGQLYVALDVFPEAAKPEAAKIKPRPHEAVLEIPTIATSLSELQSTLASIATKINALPLEQIGKNVQQTLLSATKMTETATQLMLRVDTEIAPEARAALVEARKAIASAEGALKPDSPLAQDARDTMLEVQRAAAAFRALADYLDRHPEALLRGKKDEVSNKKKESK